MTLGNLQQCSYKSPSGQIVTFDYEDIESTVEKKTAIFECAVGNGTYVQSNGRTSGRFPMRCIISGDNYADKAEAFLSAVLEDGDGVLTHPIYGDITAVPGGQIARLDPLKSGAGQVIYDVQFFETTGLQIGETGGVDQIFDSLLEASAVDFSNGVKLNDAVDRAAFRSRFQSAMKKMSIVMKNASGSVRKITEGIDDKFDSIDRGIDIMMGSPLSLAKQVQILIGEPRREVGHTSSKVMAYNGMATDIFAGTLAEPSKYNNEAINLFHMNKMMAHGIVCNLAMLLFSSTDFTVKTEYISAAENLIALMGSYQLWRDDNYKNIDTGLVSAATIDIGDGVPEMRQLVSLVVSTLITRSFKAKTEIREPLSSSRTPIDLCYELYGTNESKVFDSFTNDNQLAGDEFFMIPKGREIVWYV